MPKERWRARPVLSSAISLNDSTGAIAPSRIEFCQMVIVWVELKEPLAP
jgi:hypothetical protein